MNVKKEDRLVRKIPDRVKKKADGWGDTTDGPGETSKLIFVSNLPSVTSIDEIKQFFKLCGKVVGVHLSEFFAIVKFERPLEASKAIGNNSTTFKGRTLRIRNWNPSQSRSVRDKSARSPHERRVSSGANSDRRRSRSEARFRSRSRSRSRSSSTYRRRHRDSSPTSPRNSSTRQNPSVSDDIHESANDNGSFDLNQHSWSSLRSNNQPDLPKQIRLILEFVLNDNSARNLSYTQLNTLIDYFKHESQFIWGPAQDTPNPSDHSEVAEPEQEPAKEPQPENHDEEIFAPPPNLDESNAELESDDEQLEDNIVEMIQKATGRG